MRKFEWIIKEEEAFDALKEALSTATVLGYPDFSQEFILETDAYLKGFRCCPVTIEKGQNGPCYCMCKLLIMPIQKINV